MSKIISINHIKLTHSIKSDPKITKFLSQSINRYNFLIELESINETHSRNIKGTNKNIHTCFKVFEILKEPHNYYTFTLLKESSDHFNNEGIKISNHRKASNFCQPYCEYYFYNNIEDLTEKHFLMLLKG